MTWNLSDLVRRAIDTIFAPRSVATQLMALRLDTATAWQLLILVTLLSVVGIEAVALLFAASGAVEMAGPIGGAFALAIVQASVAVLMAVAIYWGGRAFGGEGRLADAVLLVAWLQFVLLCLQVVQMVFLLLIPVMAAYLGIVAVILFFWLLTQFVATLHGFESLGRVFVGILGGMFGLFIVLTIVLALFGFQLPEVPQNV